MTFKKSILLALILNGFVCVQGIAAQGVESSSAQACTIDTCFTPKEECLPRIIKAIESATESIYVMAYYITQPPIADALIKAHNAGIKVEIVMDRSQLGSPYSALPTLYRAGVPCFIDKKGIRLQHNKLMIIDGKLLLTGSYNWTRSAEIRNAENLMFIEKNLALLQRYKDYYAGRKALSYRVISCAKKCSIEER